MHTSTMTQFNFYVYTKNKWFNFHTKITREKHSQNLFLTISKSQKKSINRRKYLKTVILTYTVIINTNKELSTRVPEKNIYFCFIDYAKAFDCVDHNKLWKILKKKGIPDLLTCLLRNLYAGQEATVRTAHGATDWFQIGRGVHQGCIFHRAYLTYMQSIS